MSVRFSRRGIPRLITEPAKQFRYLTPTLNVLPTHFKTTPLLSSRSFHILASPLECLNHISDLFSLRRIAGFTRQPIIIWEPRPASCSAENLDDFIRAVRLVDVFSPNHIELAAIFGILMPTKVDRVVIQEMASKFLKAEIGSSGHGAVIVRAGQDGCFIHSATQPAKWLPAYYEAVDAEAQKAGASPKVIDPTGAGNAFLGGYAIGFLQTGSAVEAACYGTVAASFALEQIGIPALSRSSSGEELWNDVSVSSRLREYKLRVRVGVGATEVSRNEVTN